MEAEPGLRQDQPLAPADEGQGAGGDAVIRHVGDEAVLRDQRADRRALIDEAAFAGEMDALDRAVGLEQPGEPLGRPLGQLSGQAYVVLAGPEDDAGRGRFRRGRMEIGAGREPAADRIDRPARARRPDRAGEQDPRHQGAGQPDRDASNTAHGPPRASRHHSPPQDGSDSRSTREVSIARAATQGLCQCEKTTGGDPCRRGWKGGKKTVSSRIVCGRGFPASTLCRSARAERRRRQRAGLSSR